jgi:hypothetical protein
VGEDKKIDIPQINLEVFMKMFCIILSFFLVLILFSCSKKSEIAVADTIATDPDSKSTEVVKTPVKSPVFSVTETKTFRELGLLTPETQSKYLKLSLNDFKAISFVWSPSWSPGEILDVSVIDFVKHIQMLAQLAEVAVEMAIPFASPPTEEQVLKKLKDSKEEADREAYNNVMLLRRIMKAWGLR